jgi:hypothetical protein
MSADQQVVTVTVPAGMEAGSKLNVKLEDGRIFEIIVPPNCRPNQSINVVIPFGLEQAQQSVPIMNNEASKSVEIATTNSTPKEITKVQSSVGASAAALVVGTLVVGPMVGIAVAGATLYATTRSDDVGKASRAVGTSVVTAYEKGMEHGKKSGFFDRMKDMGSKSVAKAKEINNEYKLTEKASSAAASGIVKAKELNNKYDVTNSIAKGVSKGANGVTKALSGSKDANNTVNGVSNENK